ncbi:MAG: hypothetical protein ACKV2Q_19405 [Planctomycetaceae bacterium]
MARLTRGWLFEVLSSVILVAVLSGQANAQKPPEGAKTPEAQVRAALADAIKRLDDGDTRGFLEYYFPTEQLRQLRLANAVEQTADRLKQQPEILEGIRVRLRKAAKGTPKLDRSQSVAEFILTPEEGDTPKPAEFKEPAVKDVKLVGFGNDLAIVLRKAEETLDKKDVDGFVKNLFPAGELRHPDADSRRAALTQRLKDNPKLFEQMLTDIKAMQKLTPKLSDAKDVAEYRLPGTPIEINKQQSVTSPERVFKLQLVEGSWRLPDNTTTARRAVAQNLAKPLPAIGQFAAAQEKITFERFGDQWRLAP